VNRCLAKSPADRFADGAEIVAALGAAKTPAAVTASRTEVSPLTRTDDGRSSPPRVVTRLVALVAVVAAVGALVWGVGRWRTAPPANVSPATLGSTAPASSEDPMSRSQNPEAQHLFDLAMQSVHDGTGQERSLLEQAVQVDPTFAGAYLRLTLLSQARPGNEERYRRMALTYEASLSPRDRALFEALDEPDEASIARRLDAYLARYPDDDLAWPQRLARATDPEAILEKALAARPGLPLLLAWKARVLESEEKRPEAARTLDDCLAHSPRAVDCLAARVATRDRDGVCPEAEQDVRRWLDIQPDAPKARPLLAGLLAGRGAPIAAVREALGDPKASDITLAVAGAQVLLPMFEGDLVEVLRVSGDSAASLPASASEHDHFLVLTTIVLAFTEEGDLASAGRVAADYLAKRSAWVMGGSKAMCPPCDAAMQGAAARGGKVDPKVAAERIAADYQDAVSHETAAVVAWTMTYAYAAYTPAEARAAVAKLDEIHDVPSSAYYNGASSRTAFLGGRAELARPLLEGLVRPCDSEFQSTMNWVRSHLYLGELDEQAGNEESACAHYGKVLARWGHAKPKSVTADEARAHAKKLGCALPP
jgi:serine/threonine-protein kinase